MSKTAADKIAKLREWIAKTGTRPATGAAPAAQKTQPRVRALDL